MNDMVVGFIFSTNGQSLLLMRKTHPSWQRGRLNGIGGHMEGHESPPEAMSRECAEETGVVIPSNDWRDVAIIDLSEEGVMLHVFMTRHDMVGAVAQTEELLVSVNAFTLPGNVIANLRWLVPLALNIDAADQEPLLITYDNFQHSRLV